MYRVLYRHTNTQTIIIRKGHIGSNGKNSLTRWLV